MTQNFTIEEFRLLAKAERDMDSGVLSYVVNNGNRLAVNNDVMEELGLSSGQSVNDTMVTFIIKANLARVEMKIKLEKIKNP